MLWKQLIKLKPPAFYPFQFSVLSCAHKRWVLPDCFCWLGFIGVLYQPAFD